MITIRITRKDQPVGLEVRHTFERSRIGRLHEDIAHEIENNTRLRSEITNSLRTKRGDLIDVYARNYVKDEWTLIMDMKTC